MLHRHLQSFLQFSDAHFHIITIIKVSQHFLGQALEGNPSPSSRPSGLLLLQLTTSFAEAGASVRCCRGTELLPWLLDTQGHATRFARSLAVHRFFPDFPAIVFCLPRSGLAFPMCRRAGRCCSLFLLRASRRTSRRPQGFLAVAIFPPLQYPL